MDIGRLRCENTIVDVHVENGIDRANTYIGTYMANAFAPIITNGRSLGDVVVVVERNFASFKTVKRSITV